MPRTDVLRRLRELLLAKEPQGALLEAAFETATMYRRGPARRRCEAANLAGNFLSARGGEIPTEHLAAAGILLAMDGERAQLKPPDVLVRLVQTLALSMRVRPAGTRVGPGDQDALRWAFETLRQMLRGSLIRRAQQDLFKTSSPPSFPGTEMCQIIYAEALFDRVTEPRWPSSANARQCIEAVEDLYRSYLKGEGPDSAANATAL